MNIENVLRAHGVGVGGSGDIIKSIQRGLLMPTTTPSKRITINEVNVDCSIVRLTTDGVCANETPSVNAQKTVVSANLRDSSTVRIEINTIDTSAQPYIRWEVIEFNPEFIKSKQAGITVNSDSVSTTEQSITAVNVGKAIMFATAFTTGSISTIGGASFNYWIDSSTTIKFFQVTPANARKYHWQVIEFK